MLCPACQRTIDDHETLCPFCEAVVDPQLLELSQHGVAGHPPRAQGRRAPGPPRRPAYTGPRQRPAYTGPQQRQAYTGPQQRQAYTGPHRAEDEGADQPPAGQAAIATRIVTVDPEVERGTQIVDVSVPGVVRRAMRERQRAEARSHSEAEQPPSIVDQLLTSLRQFHRRLHRMDRWTMIALALGFLSAFLPWKRVQGIGLVSGIEGLGASSAAAAAAAVCCLYTRVARRRLAGTLLLLQLLCAAGIAAAPAAIAMFHGLSGLHVGPFAAAGAAAPAVLLTLLRITRLNV